MCRQIVTACVRQPDGTITVPPPHVLFCLERVRAPCSLTRGETRQTAAATHGATQTPLLTHAVPSFSLLPVGGHAHLHRRAIPHSLIPVDPGDPSQRSRHRAASFSSARSEWESRTFVCKRGTALLTDSALHLQNLMNAYQSVAASLPDDETGNTLPSIEVARTSREARLHDGAR